MSGGRQSFALCKAITASIGAQDIIKKTAVANFLRCKRKGSIPIAPVLRQEK